MVTRTFRIPLKKFAKQYAFRESLSYYTQTRATDNANKDICNLKMNNYINGVHKKEIF